MNYLNIRNVRSPGDADQDGPYDLENSLSRIESCLRGQLAHGPVDIIIKPRGLIEGPRDVPLEEEFARQKASAADGFEIGRLKAENERLKKHHRRVVLGMSATFAAGAVWGAFQLVSWVLS